MIYPIFGCIKKKYLLKKVIDILLVEDDPDDMELLETAFKDSGIQAKFTFISHGDKAVPYLDSCQQLPDVLVLDLNLPRVHGKEILKGVKSNSRYSQLPIVMLTTSSIQSDIDFCLNAGATYYFTKPTRIAELDKIVNAIVLASK